MREIHESCKVYEYTMHRKVAAAGILAPNSRDQEIYPQEEAKILTKLHKKKKSL